MNKPPTVFLSFSSRDMKYVNDLIAVLKYQNIDIWDYSNEIEAIEAGTFIEDRLKDEICNRDVFIPLVSSNSLDEKTGRYTRLETAYAIKAGKKIIPLVMPESAGTIWAPPYDALQSLLYLKFDFNYDIEFARNMFLLCSKLNVEFQPLDKSHHKLPLWSFFRSEIHELPKSNYHYGMLMGILWSFNKCFFEEDWIGAEQRIRLFTHNCEYFVPGYRIFYPHIVHAVCLRNLSRYDEAEESYLKAGKNRPGYAEENIYGGLAGISFERGDNEKSFQLYEKSLQLAPDGLNSDEKFNYAVAMLITGRAVDSELSGFVLDLDPEDYGREARHVYNAKAWLLSTHNQFTKAVAILKEAIQNDNFDENTFLFYSKFILVILENVKKGDPESLNILEGLTGYTREGPVLDFLVNMLKVAHDKYFPESLKLARQLIELSKLKGDFAQAAMFFEDYILGENNTREELIEYALLNYYLGNKAVALAMAQKILLMSEKKLPETHRELYFEGYAHFLAGDADLARLCYIKSRVDLSYYKLD